MFRATTKTGSAGGCTGVGLGRQQGQSPEPSRVLWASGCPVLQQPLEGRPSPLQRQPPSARHLCTGEALRHVALTRRIEGGRMQPISTSHTARLSGERQLGVMAGWKPPAPLQLQL